MHPRRAGPSASSQGDCMAIMSVTIMTIKPGRYADFLAGTAETDQLLEEVRRQEPAPHGGPCRRRGVREHRLDLGSRRLRRFRQGQPSLLHERRRGGHGRCRQCGLASRQLAELDLRRHPALNHQPTQDPTGPGFGRASSAVQNAGSRLRTSSSVQSCRGTFDPGRRTPPSSPWSHGEDPARVPHVRRSD